jgi:hypothetical protein
MTYSDICREAAQELENFRVADTLGRDPKPLASAVYFAGHLRSLADLLDTASNACVGTREADESMERIFSPLSEP